VYAYNTNAAGVYPKRGNETGNGRRHGYLRGWARTGADGRYALHTIRPGAYPGRNDPAHIHVTITPPSAEEYWIDEVVFNDDPLLTADRRSKLPNLGGSGIVSPVRNARGVLIATRNITLKPTTTAAVGGFDTLMVDTAASVVRWKGTKFLGLGKHEGIVRIGSGSLAMNGTSGIAGAFTIDMRTIEVTDIPSTDPIPRNRLRDHLVDEDFFWVDRYPVASFVLTSVRRAADNRYTVDGTLTMRGVSHPVSFEATLLSFERGVLRVKADLEINRHR